jgi:diguanylate cyclase (GGDEF)-like protein
MKIHVADKTTLSRLLNRKKRPGGHGYEVDLAAVLKGILTWANRLVPSESGSVLLDDPVLKRDRRKRGKLFFSACFGKGSSALVGTALPSMKGIAGAAYTKGLPHISKDVKKEPRFCSEFDAKTGFETLSVICAPIVIDSSPIGVIELINRKGRVNYEPADLDLLEVFAGYTATLIHNALMARRFEELSQTDNLTGLYNDRYFFRCLERAVEEAARQEGEISLIFFDLDRFKDVNDTYGHQAGSSVLREVAGILREVFADEQAIMARYGGDEYVIGLPETGVEKAAALAEEMRARMERNVFLKKRAQGMPALHIGGVITCSIGVACLDGRRVSATNVKQMVDSLIRAADLAMYQSKESGKNRITVAREVSPRMTGERIR